MKVLRWSLLAALAPISLAACNQVDSSDSASEDTAVAEQAAPAEDAASEMPEPVPTPTSLPSEIPSNMQGRWGINQADCAGGAAAKGLLIIGPTEMKFYESVGRLANTIDHETDRLRATFNFSGEGMTWQRELVLDLQDGGSTLVRRENGVDAAPGEFRYKRCDGE